MIRSNTRLSSQLSSLHWKQCFWKIRNFWKAAFLLFAAVFLLFAAVFLLFAAVFFFLQLFFFFLELFFFILQLFFFLLLLFFFFLQLFLLFCSCFSSFLQLFFFFLQLFFCVLAVLFCVMEAVPAPEPQISPVRAIAAGAAIKKAIGVKGKDSLWGRVSKWADSFTVPGDDFTALE